MTRKQPKRTSDVSLFCSGLTLCSTAYANTSMHRRMQYINIIHLGGSNELVDLLFAKRSGCFQTVLISSY